MHAGVSGAAPVLGGSGTVGSEVVRQLAGPGVPVVFTYFQGRERAEALLAELSRARAVRIDLRDGAAIRQGARPDDAREHGRARLARGPGGLRRGLSPGCSRTNQKFSALRRKGTPVEAARAIVWLARENRYMSGKVLSGNGGI